jgi:hypothetical protein
MAFANRVFVFANTDSEDSIVRTRSARKTATTAESVNVEKMGRENAFAISCGQAKPARSDCVRMGAAITVSVARAFAHVSQVGLVTTAP